ncbi:MAG: class I SAM-dependent methyltransferase [Acidobacteria bacterium]|nr:class I SAM-dependent methyltransferase [Acidobacteriota bacterium]
MNKRYLVGVILNKYINKIPIVFKNIIRNSKLEKFYNLLYDKYTAELSFQTRWAKAYNYKSEKLANDLTILWKENRCLDDILRICCINEESTVLDVGCGIATVLHIIKGRRFGVDPLAEEYKRIYNYPENIVIVKGFAESLPFPNDYFDFVFCSNVLDHTTKPELAIEEIKRVLTPQGSFVLVLEIMDSAIKRDIKHPHTFTLDSIKDLLSSKGFVVLFEKVVPWPGGLGSKGYIAIFQKR